jgi:hypothetical protein
MSGAARCDRPTEAALQLIPPATGTPSGISPVGSSGTVPNLPANSRNPQYLTQRLSAERRRTCEAGPRGGLQRTCTPMA